MRYRLMRRLKLKLVKLLMPRRKKNLLLPLQFNDKYKNSGVEGELAYVELDNSRKMYGYKSTKNLAKFYSLISDLLPPTLNAETYGCALDVAYRYLRDLPYPRKLLPARGGTIAEIGAYVGHKTIKFIDDVVGIEGKVLAVEMMPDNFAILERNIHENNIKNVMVRNVGVWSSKGIKQVLGTTQQRNSLVQFDECDSSVTRGFIQTDTLDGILGEWDVPIVDLLYIRVNGAEIEVLDGLDVELKKVKVIFVASHYTREGLKVKVKVKELLEQKGCKIVYERGNWIYALTKQFADLEHFYRM